MCGVAWKGDISTIEANGSRKPYIVWKNMIHRCYNPNIKSYKYYGGKGVRVSQRWLTYSNFREDLEKIPGFDEKLFYDNKIELDKDLKSKGDKVYSLETCVFLTPLENNSNLETREFRPEQVETRVVGKNKNGDIVCIVNVPMYAKSIGIHPSEIYAVASGEALTSRGWTYKKVKDLKVECTIDGEFPKQKRFGPKATRYEVTDEEGKTIIYDDVKRAAKALGCSSSLLTQRTRGNVEYTYKGNIVRREDGII